MRSEPTWRKSGRVPPCVCGAALLAVGAVGCGGGERSDDLARFSGDKKVEASVDGAGAELVLGDELKLRIPEGALAEAVDVRVSRVTSKDLEAAEPVEPRLSDLVKFEPHGLAFERPVEIELRVKDDEVPDRELAVRRLDDERDESWEEVAQTRVLKPEAADELEGLAPDERALRSARRVKATTKRFSIYTVVQSVEDAGDADGGVEGDAGTDTPVDAGRVDAAPVDAAVAPEPVTLSSLPIDLPGDCPSYGCTLSFEPIAIDGVWVDCDYAGDPTGFDPATFDFASACVMTYEDPSYIDFTSTSEVFELDASGGSDVCDVLDTAVDPAGYLARGGCSSSVGGLFMREDPARMVDGVLYTYDFGDCDGTCSPYLYVKMLDARDTTALAERCAGAELHDYRCGAPGSVFPFGPSGVGDMPAALADTSWLSCDGDLAQAPADAELEGLCADSVSNWQSNGAEVYRFNAEGTADVLELDVELVWTGTCAVPAGADATTGRAFLCPEFDEGRIAGSVELTYEVRTVGGTDYLVARWDDNYFVLVEFAQGPAGAEDPCTDAPAMDCILQ